MKRSVKFCLLLLMVLTKRLSRYRSDLVLCTAAKSFLSSETLFLPSIVKIQESPFLDFNNSRFSWILTIADIPRAVFLNSIIFHLINFEILIMLRWRESIQLFCA